MRLASSIALWLLTAALLPAAELQLSLRHTFRGEPLLLDSLRYGNGDETLSVTRLSYLLSGVALQRESGEWLELAGSAAWIDAAQRRTSFTLHDVPAGRFTALRFFIGPDAAANHAPVASFAVGHPFNPAVNGLHWSWQGGFVFLALEGRYRAGSGTLEGYSYHLARDPNRTAITLPVTLAIDHAAALELEFDVAKSLNALSCAHDGSATHSRDGDPLVAALTANLRTAFRPQIAGTSIPTAPAPLLQPLLLPAKFTPYRFTFNRNFPLPSLPMDNPLIEERVALGRALFFDPALSRDRSVSCASCHQAGHGLADSRRASPGVAGRLGERNAMPLANLAWKSSYRWDGGAATLREQALLPIQDHREMDLQAGMLVERLRGSTAYQAAFRAAFSSASITAETIGLALEQFLLTLRVGDSKFDRALRGGAELSSVEQRGFELFMTEYDPRTGQRGADCFHCHGGPLFSDFQFHNNGLAITGGDTGRERVTQHAADRGKFATPSLRNVARTAPYMHDGRFATLEEVVAHYNAGLEPSETLDPNLAKHPRSGLQLPPEDVAALVAFLHTLTEESDGRAD